MVETEVEVTSSLVLVAEAWDESELVLLDQTVFESMIMSRFCSLVN